MTNKKTGRKKTGLKRPNKWVTFYIKEDQKKHFDNLFMKAKLESNKVALTKVDFVRQILENQNEESIKKIFKEYE